MARRVYLFVDDAGVRAYVEQQSYVRELSSESILLPGGIAPPPGVYTGSFTFTGYTLRFWPKTKIDLAEEVERLRALVAKPKKSVRFRTTQKQKFTDMAEGAQAARWAATNNLLRTLEEQLLLGSR